MKALKQLLKKHPRLILVLGLAYIISPLDFIPGDLFTMIGLADDAAVAGVMIQIIRHLKKKKAAEQAEKNTSQTSQGKDSDPSVIDVESEKL